MGAIRFDLVVEKRSQFYKELDVMDEDGNPIDLTSLVLICTIRESLETSTNLFQLTEANGGIVVLDALHGKMALYISSTDTNIVASNGVYDVVQSDPAYPLLDNYRLMHGLVKFSKGLT